MINHKEFLSANKSMVIAPAGHGKTHLITECLTHTEGKQLILTHTHAGVAAINEKIKKVDLESKKYHVETITGYAQKYVQAYCSADIIPDRENTEKYYAFLIDKARAIIASPVISHSIKSTYKGLFADEYQDCTTQQHELINQLSKLLPTRILGDPLQGIFSFNGSIEMVNLNDTELLEEFILNVHVLEEAWRWKGVNEKLGKDLQRIRFEIESKNKIDLSKYPTIEYIKINSSADLFIPNKQYYRDFNRLLSSGNLLIIHPSSSSIHPRKKIISNFKTPITLLESIDDKDFYSLSKKFDDLGRNNFNQVLYEVSNSLFNKTEINKWIDESRVKGRTGEWSVISAKLKELISKAVDSKDAVDYAEVLEFVNKIKGIRCLRKELFYSLCGALRLSSSNKTTVLESMIDRRNHIRKIGKKVFGRCIGTTLLTKGLEFENVVILNAHEFECPKNLYVALTRASKKLIVFSTNPVLSPIY